MRKLFGSPLNINKSIVGKVTHKPIKRLKRHDFILISDEQKIDPGYSAIITNSSVPNLKIPLLYNVKDLEQLRDGDIVLLDPDGAINVLYEKGSFDNSLMITERCNCSCIMCPQPPIATEDDKTPFNLKLISLMDRNTPSLGLTGGEPTLLGNNLVDMIHACKKILPKTKLNLLTNGIRFEDLGYVKKIAMVQHPNLFIDIPLYADTDTEHNNIIRAKGFYKTIKGLYNLILFKQRIGIRIVIMKINYLRLPYLSEFIYHNFPFVFHIAFMQMETVGLAKDNIKNLWIDPFDYNEQLEKSVTYLAQRDMNVSIYNAQLCVLPKTLWKYARKSISSWKNIYLNECSLCDYREECGGLFASSLDKHSKYIKPLKKTK